MGFYVTKCLMCLFLCRCTDWARFGASAALNAFVGIDAVFAVAFANGIYRAFAFAGATGDTFVRNFIRQTYHLLDLFASIRYA